MSMPAPDFTGLTLAELEAKRDQVENDLASIKAKLANVRAKQKKDGVYADPEWYRRAITRETFLGLEHQAVTRRIAQVKRDQRETRQVRLETAFITAARELLEPADFSAVMRRAEAATAA